MSEKVCSPLRTDAERNRERIVAAARRLVSREGLGVSMTAVAREAGVGNATLFRRFGTRERLIDAVFLDRVEAHHRLVTACSDDPDPWQGFADYVRCVCALQAADPTFVEALTMTFPAGVVETRRAAAARGALGLISRAQQAGCLREDFSDRDLTVLLLANAGVVGAAGTAAGIASRRLVAQMLRAYATPDAPVTPLPEAPPRPALYHAMIGLIRSRPA
ncbi:TetR/AcrR family transcriptional regulator [Streptomyces longispororuber]|uniref:TetR/AcrR family transcriptional regulator n=1 Tax=Streptomyces longispororuber TaxID=68230 RepID=UPI00210AEA93|nr:TetR/AcrR family transcriptional regulator [Streptomyces longispororuber]MCQ4205952.1 TetR/AcrR family transcriptional regulator [Streptomyces longispororuber]